MIVASPSIVVELKHCYNCKQSLSHQQHHIIASNLYCSITCYVTLDLSTDSIPVLLLRSWEKFGLHLAYPDVYPKNIEYIHVHLLKEFKKILEDRTRRPYHGEIKILFDMVLDSVLQQRIDKFQQVYKS